MSLKVQTIVNQQYNSNTYLIKNKIENETCYLIDIGNFEGVLQALKVNQEIKAIFLTHAHYDHVCGILEILKKYPYCIIYCSAYTKEALADSKVNLSFYHKNPITYIGNNSQIIIEKDIIQLFPDVFLEVIETPGHNSGSITFKIDESFFTGDSLIPETAVVTKLKSGNKIMAKESISKIKNSAKSQDNIYPGHGKSYKVEDVNWDYYLSNN